MTDDTDILDLARQVIRETDDRDLWEARCCLYEDHQRRLRELLEEDRLWRLRAYRLSRILLAYSPALGLLVLGTIVRGVHPLLPTLWLVQTCVGATVMFQQCKELHRTLQ